MIEFNDGSLDLPRGKTKPQSEEAKQQEDTVATAAPTAEPEKAADPVATVEENLAPAGQENQAEPITEPKPEHPQESAVTATAPDVE